MITILGFLCCYALESCLELGRRLAKDERMVCVVCGVQEEGRGLIYEFKEVSILMTRPSFHDKVYTCKHLKPT